MRLSWVHRSKHPSRTSGSAASRKPLRLQLEELEDRRVPASAATNAYVNAVYEAVLHRPADAQGLAYWGNLIDSGQQTRQQVALGIQTSQEGENVLINSLYLQILGREADPGGLAYWRGVFEANNKNDQKGGTGDNNFDDPDDFNFDGVTAVRVGLFSSAEFLNNAGGTANGFVTQLYVVGLGRQPDAGGLASFLAGLNVTDISSRMTAAFILINSLEALTNEVNGFYLNILGRQGEPAGVNSWVANLRGGTNTISTISGFLGSPEFNNDAVSNPSFAPDATPSTAPGGAIIPRVVTNLTVDPECQGNWVDDTSDAAPGTPHRAFFTVNANSGTVKLNPASGVLSGSGSWKAIELTTTTPNPQSGGGTVHSFFAIVTADSGTTFTGPGGSQLSQVLMQFDCTPGGAAARASFFDTQGNLIDNTVERIDLVRG